MLQNRIVPYMSPYNLLLYMMRDIKNFSVNKYLSISSWNVIIYLTKHFLS